MKIFTHIGKMENAFKLEIGHKFSRSLVKRYYCAMEIYSNHTYAQFMVTVTASSKFSISTCGEKGTSLDAVRTD